MRKLLIGADRFTDVFAVDKPGAGGACHEYLIETKELQNVGEVKFQKGPVKETVANGCFIEDLITIVIDRLQGFQNGDFPCRENALALTKLEEALHWLDHRTNDRQRRGVEGTFKE
jgi:hypothetical protein